MSLRVISALNGVTPITTLLRTDLLSLGLQVRLDPLPFASDTADLKSEEG